jgi:NAD(P)-dependent dehydrogenase (short-subunit alcohol dehydrogenase family)
VITRLCRSHCHSADDAALTAALARTLVTHQHIDALILNAGTLYPLGTVVQDAPTVNEWRAHFDVNFFSLVTALQAAMPALRARGGRVVFTSSGSAIGATAGWAPYNASKAALNSLCRTVANEEPDVTFVALRPGMVDTSVGHRTLPVCVSQLTLPFIDAGRAAREHA